MNHIAIIETDVLGVKAYEAKCLDAQCDWHTSRYNQEATAFRAAEAHGRTHHIDDTVIEPKRIIKVGDKVEKTFDDGEHIVGVVKQIQRTHGGLQYIVEIAGATGLAARGVGLYDVTLVTGR